MAERKPHRSLVVTMLLAAAFHWPLLLSDSVLWDDITLVHAHQVGDTELLVEQFADAGAPQWGRLHAHLLSLPQSVRWYKLASLVCIMGAAGGIHLLFRRDERMAPGDARLIALLATAYPFYSLWQNLIMLPYAISYLLFFVGAACFRKHVARGKLLSLSGAVALPLLAASFTIESFGVFFYGLAAYILWSSLPAASPVRFSAVLRAATRQLPALVLPAAVYLGKRWLFPMQNAYADYNRVRLTPAKLLEGAEDFLKRSIFDPPEAVARLAFDEPLAFVVLATGGAILATACVAVCRLTRDDQPKANRRLMLLWSAVLYAAAAFAYIAVGKAPVLFSYESRHALLLGLPLAAGAVAAVRLATGKTAAVRMAFAALLVCGFVLQTRSSILWQNRYIKARGIAENLQLVGEDLGAVVLIDDAASFGMPEKWRCYEVHWMLRQATGQERRFGFDVRRLKADRPSLCESPTNRRFFGCRDAPLAALTDPRSADTYRVATATGAGEEEIFVNYFLAKDKAAYARALVRLSRSDADPQRISALPAPGSK